GFVADFDTDIRVTIQHVGNRGHPPIGSATRSGRVEPSGEIDGAGSVLQVSPKYLADDFRVFRMNNDFPKDFVLSSQQGLTIRASFWNEVITKGRRRQIPSIAKSIR